MRGKIGIVVAFGCALLILGPLSAFGQDNYLAFKAGIYTPTGDLTDDGADFGTGFNGEIAWGHYLMPNFVIEPAVGYFTTDDTIDGFLDVDVWVVPVTATAKYMVPLQTGDVYFGAGLGVYFAEAEMEAFGMEQSESDTVFGGHIVAGANFDLNPQWFIGVEGKYLLTGEFDPEIDDGVDLNGYTFSAVLGYRF